MSGRVRALTLAAVLVTAGSGHAQTPAPGTGTPLDVLIDPGSPASSTPSRTSYATRRQIWPIGDVMYGRQYHGTIAVTNTCSSEQRYGIFVYGLPEVTVARTIAAPAGETVQLPYALIPRQRSSAASTPLDGELVVWRPGSGSACPALRVVHAARGEARVATPADEAAELAKLEDAALRAVCMTWWLSGERPGAEQIDKLPAVARRGAVRADEGTCAEVMRPAARSLRERLVDSGPPGTTSPAWLPDAAALDRMSMTELATFRRRGVEREAAAKERSR